MPLLISCRYCLTPFIISMCVNSYHFHTYCNFYFLGTRRTFCLLPCNFLSITVSFLILIKKILVTLKLQNTRISRPNIYLASKCINIVPPKYELNTSILYPVKSSTHCHKNMHPILVSSVQD